MMAIDTFRTEFNNSILAGSYTETNYYQIIDVVIDWYNNEVVYTDSFSVVSPRSLALRFRLKPF